MSTKVTDDQENMKEFKITPGGSLGLLAYGDIGLREWRKVRNEYTKTIVNEEE